MLEFRTNIVESRLRSARLNAFSRVGLLLLVEIRSLRLRENDHFRSTLLSPARLAVTNVGERREIDVINLSLLGDLT